MQNFQSYSSYSYSENDRNLPFNYKMWWEYKNKDDSDLLMVLRNHRDKIKGDMGNFYEDFYFYSKLYEDKKKSSVQFAYSDDVGKYAKSWNLVRVACDAHFNRVARITPKVSFLTKGAKIGLNQLSKKLDDWLLHLFKSSNIYKPYRRSYKDAVVGNLGVARIYIDKKEQTFRFKRVNPYSIGIEKPEEGEETRSEFTEIFKVKYHDLEEMIEKSDISKKEMMKLKKQIHEAHGEDKEKFIELTEIHRKRKKRVLFTDKVCLEYEDWKYKWLPYLLFKWDEKTEGVTGTGVTEVAKPAQLKINDLLYKIDKNTELFGVHYIIVPKNSDFQKIDNDFGRVYEANTDGSDRRPQHVTPPILNDQVFKQVSETYQIGKEACRLSDLQSEGRVPVGLNQGSGKALKYFADLDNSRFYNSIALYEENFIETAKNCFEWACDNFTSDPLFKEASQKKEEFKKAVNLFTGNLLPDTPSGRFDVLANLVQLQVIKPDKFMDLLDAPDVSGFLRSESARVVAIEKYLEDSFLNNKPAVVDPVLGYEEQKEIALRIYSQILKDSEDAVDDERLNNIHIFLKNIKEKQEAIKLQQLQKIVPPGTIPDGGETPPSGATLPSPNQSLEPGKPPEAGL